MATEETTINPISSISAEQWLTTSPMFRGLSPIDYLYNKLSILYPKRWAEQFRNETEIEIWKTGWSEEFEIEKFTFDEIALGLKNCKKLHDWPPSFPEFLKACRPAVDYEGSFYEAVEQMRLRDEGRDKWSHPAVYWAAVKLGNDMKSTVYLNIQNRWRAALDEAFERIQSGLIPNQVPVRRERLPAPKHESGKEMSGVAVEHIALAKEILSREPAWKARLREKGGNPDAGGMKSIGEVLNESSVNLAVETLAKD